MVHYRLNSEPAATANEQRQELFPLTYGIAFELQKETIMYSLVWIMAIKAVDDQFCMITYKLFFLMLFLLLLMFLHLLLWLCCFSLDKNFAASFYILVMQLHWVKGF